MGQRVYTNCTSSRTFSTAVNQANTALRYREETSLCEISLKCSLTLTKVFKSMVNMYAQVNSIGIIALLATTIKSFLIPFWRGIQSISKIVRTISTL
ncbi:hypothetical protein WH47_08926 [Habropoda laboriosa]|uniref:Uncharacterized protein n=1 Tax=Habropoda laboriosa TaxID=597456 RepID=A0A0L7R6R0_9HYME|nr:hypothetical protein WH47_08926 [Habropoda laboriosa]